VTIARTWREAPTSCSAERRAHAGNRRSPKKCERLAKGEEKFVDDEEFVYFFHVDSFYRVRARLERIFGHFKRETERSTTRLSASAPAHPRHERHEARRIDNQLRGRAAAGRPRLVTLLPVARRRLMRIFGGPYLGLMQRLGMEEAFRSSTHGSRAIERAQKQVEAQNFSVRKHSSSTTM